MHAQRIVSLAPSVTQTIIELGGDAMVVGRTSYCPPSASSTVVGDVLTVSLEQIVALRPDVVFTMGFTQPATIDRLRQMGIRVETLATPTSFAQICEQTLHIASIAALLPEAEAVVTAEKQKVDDISNRRAVGATAFFQIGAQPLFAAAQGTYLHDMLAMCGLRNIAPQGNGATQREYVVRSQPDYIVITQLGGLRNDEVALWQKLCKATIVHVDENVACCPTPRNFRLTLETICNQLK